MGGCQGDLNVLAHYYAVAKVFWVVVYRELVAYKILYNVLPI